MFERLRQSDMLMYELGELLFKKVDTETMEIYEAITVLLTRTKKDLVQRTAPLFPSVMVMKGKLVMFQWNKVLVYLLMMHKEGRPDQGGLLNPTQSTTQKSLI